MLNPSKARLCRLGAWLFAVLLATLPGPGSSRDEIHAAADGPPPRSGLRTEPPDGTAPRARARVPAGGGLPVPGPNVDASTSLARQNEPAIAVDPNNPNRVVIGANDYRAGDSAMWVYPSTDGGQSFPSAVEIVDPDPDRNFDVPPGPTVVRGDPALAWDLDGNLYANFISFVRGNDEPGGLFVARSTDGGFTWPQAARLQANDLVQISDKPYLAVDTSSSPHRGNVYVSWTRFQGAAGDILVSRSTDGGATFSTIGPISACHQTQGSVPAVGPFGEVYVVWQEFPTAAGCASRIAGAKSLDGGATFGPSFTVGALNEISDPLPHTRFRTDSFPSMAVNQVSGDVYVAWADDSSGNADVLLSRSSNAGKSWSKPRRVNDDRTDNAQFFPWVAVVPSGEVAVIFMDRRDDPANYLMHTYLAISDNGGRKFSPNLRLTDIISDPEGGGFVTFIGDYIGLAALPGGVHGAWTDTRTGDQEIFAARVPLGLSPPVAPGGLDAVLSTGGDVRLSWQDRSANEQAFRVERRFSDQLKWRKLANLPPNATTALDTKARAGRSYCYRVLALGPREVPSPPSNQGCVAIPD